jgi:hypothetical protein
VTRPTLPPDRLTVLLLYSAFNGLSQRIDIELRAAGHTVHRQLMADGLVDAVAAVDPDLIVCPYLRSGSRMRCGPGGPRSSSIPARKVTEAPARWTGPSWTTPPPGV